MRSMMMLALALGLGVTSVARADNAKPCKTIVQACQSAGFTRHAKEKNLRRDCMKPIMGGQTIEGVTVDPNDVQACQARMAERHARR